jgi:hypothetical protein
MDTMLKIALAAVFVALVMLIIRVSQLNTAIALQDQQLSDMVTHEDLKHYVHRD